MVIITITENSVGNSFGNVRKCALSPINYLKVITTQLRQTVVFMCNFWRTL